MGYRLAIEHKGDLDDSSMLISKKRPVGCETNAFDGAQSVRVSAIFCKLKFSAIRPVTVIL
jgi:hypothetical protein